MNVPGRFLRCLLCIGLCLSVAGSRAEVLAVGSAANGAASASAATQTFLWRGSQAKATLIMIPGGEGHLGLTADKADLGGFYGKTLKPLSNPGITAGLFNVVIFDSPIALPTGRHYPTSRAATEHLERIETVVRYYREKFGKPVWLMGHSNRAVSVTELYKFLKKQQRQDLVAAVIYSSGRNGADFDPDTDLPVLFLAHEKDGCDKSTIASSRRVFEQLRQGNRQKTDYVVIMSGEAESQDPCRSGYHMFYNAHEEAYRAIDRFAAELLK